MNVDINNKIEDLAQVIGAWHELERMRERCKNTEELDKTQESLDNLSEAFLGDIWELYDDEAADSDEFEDIGCVIICAGQLITASRNIQPAEQLAEIIGNAEITARLQNIRQGIHAALNATAEELVKRYNDNDFNIEDVFDETVD